MNVQMKWLTGALVMLLGLVGLYFSANAKDGSLYFAGLAIFVTCLLYVLLQIKLAYDSRAASEKTAGDAGEAR